MLAIFPKVPKIQKIQHPKALKIDVFDYPTVVWRRRPSREPREYPHKPYIAIHQSLCYIFVADSVGLSSFKFSWWAPKTHVFWNRVLNGRPRSSKVVVFGTNRKRVCDFLLVVNSNIGLKMLAAPFQRYCRFSVQNSDPTLFHPNFWGVPLGLDCRCPRSEDPKLISCIITFELTQHIRPRYINVTDRQTDRRTDDLL